MFVPCPLNRGFSSIPQSSREILGWYFELRLGILDFHLFPSAELVVEGKKWAVASDAIKLSYVKFALIDTEELELVTS